MTAQTTKRKHLPLTNFSEKFAEYLIYTLFSQFHLGLHSIILLASLTLLRYDQGLLYFWQLLENQQHIAVLS